MATKDNSTGNVRGNFVFEGIGDEQPPELKVERVDAAGERHPVEYDPKGGIVLEQAHVGQRNVLELTNSEGIDVRRYHYDDLIAHLRESGTYVLPKDVWGRWPLRFRCVSGTVEVCRPIFWLDDLVRADASILQAAGLGATADVHLAVTRPDLAAIRWPRRCQPVCDGTVSVYVQTCCCPWFDPGDILIDICKLIDCEFPVFWPPDLGDPPFGHIPGPNPGPIPGPRPGPGPDPIGPGLAHSALVTNSLKRSIAGDTTLPGPDQIIDLYRHHTVLSSLAPRERVAYIRAYPELRCFGCRCRMVKVATVAIQEDGAFDACFRLPWAGPNCTQRVVYVVEQPGAGSSRIIYDGRIGPRTFGLDEEADLLASWSARTCGRDDDIGNVGVFLNRIGTTTAANLVRSSHQDGELSFSPLTASDGLVNLGANVWGGTLALRYSFHKDLRALGAMYYRVRTQRVNDNGDAVGAPAGYVDANSWNLIQGSQIVGTSIGPTTVGGVPHLYTIPYYVDGWDFDANSYHAYIDTTGFVNNGRYLFVLDVFNSSGVRLVPSSSGPHGPGEINSAFAYQRMIPSAVPNVVNLAPVPHKALANLFRVDNTNAVSAFKGLRQTGSIVKDVFAGCQFLVGPPSDQIQLRYQAHQDTGWLASVSINLTEGIDGPPPVALLSAISTPSSTTDTGAPPATALTPARTIGSLLGADPKCSFAATMLVTTKHTNGSGALTNLWASATAAFALEQTP